MYRGKLRLWAGFLLVRTCLQGMRTSLRLMNGCARPVRTSLRRLRTGARLPKTRERRTGWCSRLPGTRSRAARTGLRLVGTSARAARGWVRRPQTGARQPRNGRDRTLWVVPEPAAGSLTTESTFRRGLAWGRLALGLFLGRKLAGERIDVARRAQGVAPRAAPPNSVILMLLSCGLAGDIYHLQANGWRAGDPQRVRVRPLSITVQGAISFGTAGGQIGRYQSRPGAPGSFTTTARCGVVRIATSGPRRSWMRRAAFLGSRT